MSRCSVLFLPSRMTSSLSDDTAVTHQPSIERVRERERLDERLVVRPPPLLYSVFGLNPTNRTLCNHRTANPSTCKLSGKYCTGFDIWPHTNTRTHTHTNKQMHMFLYPSTCTYIFDMHAALPNTACNFF